MEDADVLIITTILMMIVVGEGNDLMVILIGLCSPNIENIFFLKPGREKVSQILILLMTKSH